MNLARQMFVASTPILVLMLTPHLNAHDHGTHEPSAIHMADILVASVTRVTHDGSACHIWLWRTLRFLPPPGDTARRYVRRGFGNRGSAPSKQNSLAPSIMLPQPRKEPLVDRGGVGRLTVKPNAASGQPALAVPEESAARTQFELAMGLFLAGGVGIGSGWGNTAGSQVHKGGRFNARELPGGRV
jgi:hypothetical protein